MIELLIIIYAVYGIYLGGGFGAYFLKDIPSTKAESGMDSVVIFCLAVLVSALFWPAILGAKNFERIK